MTDREREQFDFTGKLSTVEWFIIGTLIFLLLCTLTGCKTTRTIEVPVEVPVTHTEYINKYDSIYMHDSIYLDRYTKNDTVYFEKYVYRDKYKYKTDTLRTTDSISVPVYITKTVEVNKLHWFQKGFIFVGACCMFACLIWILLKIKF